MHRDPPLPADLWEHLVPPARAAVEALVKQYEDHVRAYQAALDARSAGWTVPSAPHEILAALRAADRSWERFPYYSQRYGERGRTYTNRDSLWLAGLASRSEEEVTVQVRWLGEVLAARGMPRWLLECHLEILHVELTSLAPQGTNAYAGLCLAAGRLKEERQRWVPDPLFGELTELFASKVGAKLAPRLPEAGALIAAAVADEWNGDVQAVPGLQKWLADRDRFPERWVKAVETIIQTARERTAR